ncbi:hypothetical protein YC2023_031083 [Brassica napus]
MRRTKEDDTLRASSVKIYGKKKHRTVILPKSAEPGLTTKVVTSDWYMWYSADIMNFSISKCIGFIVHA